MSAMTSAYENAASVCIFCAGCGLLSAHAGGPPFCALNGPPSLFWGSHLHQSGSNTILTSWMWCWDLDL